MDLNKFYVGMFSLGGTKLMNDTFTTYLNSLNINALQRYGTGEDFDDADGGFFTPVSNYKNNLEYTLRQSDAVLQTNYALYLHREKIVRPAYGQSSKYQSEYNSSDLKNKIIKPGYGYLTSETGKIEIDNLNGNIQTVRKCLTNSQRAGYVVKDLYENLEQVNDLSSSHYYSDRKSNSKLASCTNLRWYIKPRIRIEQTFANNPNNKNVNVFRLDIIGFSGNLVKSVEIKASNFLNNGYYDGGYLENYFNLNDTTMSILADILNNGANQDNYVNSKIDYRIYWYDNVDMWIDYVRIDDEWAHFLIEDPDDRIPSDINRWQFNQKIRDEAEQIAAMNGFGYFYMDEFKYNNIACVAEVNKRIKQYNPNTGLVPVVCEVCIQWGSGLKNTPELHAVYDSLHSSGAVTDILLTDIYPISTNIPVPYNLSLPNDTTYPGTVEYILAENREQYNDKLSSVITNATLFGLENFKNASLKAKQYGWTLCYGTQIHTFENFNCTSKDFTGLREPTNEEIKFQSNLALAYGAKQVFHFIYTTEHYYYQDCGKNYFLWGMLNSNNSAPRINNYYEQNKWTGLADINADLRKIGEYIYNEKNLKYNATRTVNTEGLPFKYIHTIKSVYRNNQLIFPQQGNEDPSNKLYWEIGFFNPSQEIEPNSNAKYFLAVNKRCTPELKPGEGDLRELRIRFNLNDLANFNNWKLSNAVSNEVLTTFNPNTGNYISAGVFNPGEGRLFKLEPVL
ncbi:MAG TPA: hypothetical protein VHP32_08570 [Ignavibacteria bacterium]|nr:hypothetical protein [Ignavibacteria bacterium]